MTILLTDSNKLTLISVSIISVCFFFYFFPSTLYCFSLECYKLDDNSRVIQIKYTCIDNAKTTNIIISKKLQ